MEIGDTKPGRSDAPEDDQNIHRRFLQRDLTAPGDVALRSLVAGLGRIFPRVDGAVYQAFAVALGPILGERLVPYGYAPEAKR